MRPGQSAHGGPIRYVFAVVPSAVSECPVACFGFGRARRPERQREPEQSWLRSPASSLAAVMGAVRMQRKGVSARTGRGCGRKGVAELGFVRT